MSAYQQLQDVLTRTVEWERELNDLYDVAQYGLASPDSKKTVSFLKERQVTNIEILENVDVRAYGSTEWVKFTPDLKEDELIPKREFTRKSSPQEILGHILSYEQKLMSYYQSVHDHLVSEPQKDLFASLVRFREEQIGRIRNFMRAEFQS